MAVLPSKQHHLSIDCGIKQSFQAPVNSEDAVYFYRNSAETLEIV